MNSIPRILLLGALLALAGCASQPMVWHKPGASRADFDRDMAAADAYARGRPVDRSASGAAHVYAATQPANSKQQAGAYTNMAITAGAEQIAQQKTAKESFLAGKGWRKIPASELPAGGAGNGSFPAQP